MSVRPLNNDEITVSQYKFKKRIETLKAERDTLEDMLGEKSAVCKELVAENKKLSTQVKTLKTKVTNLKKEVE